MSAVSECGGALWVRDKTKSYGRCARCGRRLKSLDAQERGYGKVCWEKHLLENRQTLF